MTGMKKGIHKSKGGLIRSYVAIENGVLREVTLSGDFFMFPEEAIFKMIEHLKGKPAKREEIQRKIEEIYEKEKIQSPGTTPADFTEAIMKAIEG